MKMNKRKERIVVFFLIVGLASALFIGCSNLNKPRLEDNLLLSLSDMNSMNLVEDAYKGLVLTLIHPYIMDEVYKYYSTYLTISPVLNPENIEIISIERSTAYNHKYIVKIEAAPYIGPHNTVGIDHITLGVEPYRQISIEKFQHMKSFPIAPGWQEIIKKPMLD